MLARVRCQSSFFQEPTFSHHTQIWMQFLPPSPRAGLAARRTDGALKSLLWALCTAESCPPSHLNTLLPPADWIYVIFGGKSDFLLTTIYRIGFVSWVHPHCWGFKQPFFLYKCLALTMKALALLWIYRLYVRNKKSRFNPSILWIVSFPSNKPIPKTKT